MRRHPLLVSCLLPARGSRRSIALAVEYFQRQDYAATELIVIDDGMEELEDLAPLSERVRRVRVRPDAPAGAHWNAACEQARGAIVVHWEPEDWHAPDRIRRTVETLGRKFDLCGPGSLVCYDLGTGQAQSVPFNASQLNFGSLAYRRELWRKRPFPAEAPNAGVFAGRVPRKHIAAVEGTPILVRMVTGEGCGVGPGEPFPLKRLRGLLGEDWLFYESRIGEPAETPRGAVALAPEPARPLGPLVTCIMMARGDRRLAGHAIEYFQRQDYEFRELLIADVSAKGIADMVPSGARFRYLRLPAEKPWEECLGVARKHAAGEILVHWEESDWHAPHQVRAQVETLLRSGAEVCGISPSLFYDSRCGQGWRFHPANATAVPTGSLCYRRECADMQAARRATLSDSPCLVSIVDAAGAARLPTEGTWAPEAAPRIQNLLGDDWYFYEAPIQVASNAETPLVSCIMPTCSRRRFARRAIECFLKQDYEPRELWIVDDGSDAIRDLAPDDPRIHYLRIEKKLPVDEKLNLVRERAGGELILHWADDDWHAPNRIRSQVRVLLNSGAKACGLNQALFFDLRSDEAWLCRFPPAGEAPVYAGSLCWRKTAWENYASRREAVSASGLAMMDAPCLVSFVDERNAADKPPRGVHRERRSLAELHRMMGPDWNLTIRTVQTPAVRGGFARPLVSCIMPTFGRRRFVPLAIRYFLRQSYEPKELIVVDDGDDPVEDLIPRDKRIRYFRLEARMTVGAKRNFACEEARGEIILHWDDDDWQGAHRIRDMVAALDRGQADLCGLNPVLFYDIRSGQAWRFSYPAGENVWVYGATFGYRRSLWEHNRFAEVNVSEDNRFLWNVPPGRTVALPRTDCQVSIVHDGNVSPKAVGSGGYAEYPAEEIRRLMAGDWSYYQAGLTDEVHIESEPLTWAVATVPHAADAPCATARAFGASTGRRPIVPAVWNERRPIALVIGFYVDADRVRCAEFVDCIERNAHNPNISQIHVLVEEAEDHDRLRADYPALSLPKVTLAAHDRRVTYRDLFAYANRELAGRRAIVANADIFFDETLERLDGCELAGQLLCLSRWEMHADRRARLFEHAGSQDAWIFDAPIREFDCDFHLGKPGCDNRLAWEASQAGLAVTNPARSIRAHHLHASQVRRYSERDRLYGATSLVPASYLGAPWLWFVIPCRGRLNDVRTSIASAMAQPRSNYVLVDYGCPQASGEWVKQHYSRADVVALEGQRTFNGAEARNKGAASVDEDGILCFLDADVSPSPEFSRYILSHFEEGSFLVPDRMGAGLDTALVCSKAAFDRAGGFDEAFLEWGDEVFDLRAALRRGGEFERTFPAAMLMHRGRHRVVESTVGWGRQNTTTIHAAYRRAKEAVLAETGGISQTALSRMYEAISSCAHVVYAVRPGVAADAPRPSAALPGARKTGVTAREHRLVALTSVSPSRFGLQPDRVALQRRCIQSWRDAGLSVYSFNHPSVLNALRPLYDVDFVPVTDTPSPQYIPIMTMIKWAAERDAPILIINSDIELRLQPWEMKRLRWLAEGGLCYFVRHNYDGEIESAVPEKDGIDAFLMHGRDAAFFEECSFSMGQPVWDYWLPYTMMAHGRQIFAVEFAAAFHKNHQQGWDAKDWHRNALEFDRLTGILGADRSLESCYEMSRGVRRAIDRRRTLISKQPMEIRQWVQSNFNYRGRKTFLEIGAHSGTDTSWMAQLPGVTLHAFEPDPRNHPPQFSNVTLHRAAVSDRDGRMPFILSKHGWGQEWTASSSIRIPKNHLSRYPVTFGETIEVATVTLDGFCRKQGLGTIDFIWADIQGAEGDMIRGGREALARTRFLFTEYSDDELYEGQATLRDILQMLPDFRVIELWQDDVLLENTRFG